LVNKVLYDMGSEYVEGVNAISGERCNPHPHVFSDRVLRPGDPVYYDILHSFMGYRTCYYRCFSIGYAPHTLIDAYSPSSERRSLRCAAATRAPGSSTSSRLLSAERTSTVICAARRLMRWSSGTYT